MAYRENTPSSPQESFGTQHEPIAIVGMGCRLPGHVSSPSDLWDFLKENKSGHGRVPGSRYNAAGFYHPNAERPGSINSTGGYFLQQDLRPFDNPFFEINNLEASYMDAQQRKLLEVVYESFENAGVPLSKVRGSKTGVYVGNFTNDYMIMQYKDPEYFSRYSATGSGPTVLSNRITHCFDLRGPSVVLDTACSSSMYALHFACLALDAHDCDAAVVASANLIQSAEQQLIAVKAGILSPDSTCHTFDESANGYGRAEGAASIYLKRLSDAQRDGDPIRSIIRGTAINGNGRTPGIVQPSIDGQEAVIRAAYKRARLPTDDTYYVEAHGTGTKVGDPMELEGISRVFHHKSGMPTAVGGIKPNLGHSEGTSGLSSIIKVVLALEHGEIPATIGVKKINPSIKLDEWNLDIVTENRPWPTSQVARASVNSFGFGGANGHAIFEAPLIPAAATLNGHLPMAACRSEDHNTHGLSHDSPVLLTFSARTEHSVMEQVQNTAAFLSGSGKHVGISDLAYTLNAHRSHLATRCFTIAHPQTLSQDVARTVPKKTQPGRNVLPFAFIFTGQGAQWSGMGSQLFQQYSKFRESIRHLDDCLAGLGAADKPSWTLEGPLCTAVQVALVDLLGAWKIKPDVAIGHSSGEIAAAYSAGSLTAYKSIMAAYFRGRTVAREAREGAMMAVGLGRQDVQALIDKHGLTGQISVACDNSPQSTTLSGDAKSVDMLKCILSRHDEEKTFARTLDTGNRAYHSKSMEEVGDSYQKSLDKAWSADAALGQGTCSNVRLISSVSGSELDPNSMGTAEYWRKNLESPVQFTDAVKGLFALGRYHLVEIGPHRALEFYVKQTAASEGRDMDYYSYDSTLVRGKDAAVSMLSLVGSLFVQGRDDLPLENITPDNIASVSSRCQVLTNLPPYPWDYTAPLLWTEARAVTEFRNRPFPRHDLLGSQIPGASKLTTTWRNIIDVNELPWLQDHCLGPSIVFPAAAYLAMGAEAACQVNGVHLRECPGVEMRDFHFLKAMSFDSDKRPRLEVITEMRKASVTSVLSSDSWWQLTVSSISEADSLPTIHASGLVSLNKTARFLPRTINLNKDTMEKQATRVWYHKFLKEGLNWGPKFAVMEEIYCDRARKADESLATTHLLRGDRDAMSQSWQYIAHPISIDSMLQTAFVATTGGWVRNLRATVPVKMDSISFSAPGMLDMDLGKQWAIDTKSKQVGFGTVNIEAELYNASGETLIRMAGARCIAYQGNTQQDVQEQRNPMCRVAWRPDVTLLDAGVNPGLTKYTDWFVETWGKKGLPAGLTRLCGCLDLAVHKNPRVHILLLDVDDDTSNVILEVLKAGSPLRRFETLTQATIANGELEGHEVSSSIPGPRSETAVVPRDTKFDLVFCPGALPPGVKGWVTPSTMFITGAMVDKAGFPGSWIQAITEASKGTTNATLLLPDCQIQEQKKLDVVLVNQGGEPSELDSGILDVMGSYNGRPVPLIRLSEANESTIPAGCMIIATMESEAPMVSTMSEAQMRSMKVMTNRASLILWICHAGFIAGENPEYAPVLGLSRAVMLEQPSLRFAVLDIDDVKNNIKNTAHNIRKVVDQLMTTRDAELELSQKDQVIHSARWEPLDGLNSQFRLKQDEGLLEVPIEEAGPCQLHISHPGQMDTIHFISKDYTKPLLADQVEIEVKSVGMNAKDLYVLGAKVDTRDVSCSCECAGLVLSVGSDVTHLRPGDRVVAMAPGHFATHERLPHWALCKLEEDESYVEASTIPIVFSTAIYGLIHRAQLKRGESVLIHSAAGGVGLAAIQLAKHIGAVIFATVGNDSKREFLAREFALDPSHIFSSRDTSFLPAVLAATGGKGVDVVLNSLTGELLRSSFEACADFGRFVEIGKRDILDNGLLGLRTFGKNVSFTAFDLSNLFYSQRAGHHDLWQALLVESMDMIRKGIAKPCFPIETFSASEITQAFRYFSQGTRMGKVTVSFEDRSDHIRVKPQQYQTVFSPDKSYLMIGCLGGLGRSISKWMVARGARSLVFLGRSGLQKQDAKVLVNDLRAQDVHVEVVQGDVSSMQAVEMAIQHATLPIGGVIQAAMGLSEALWSEMSHKSWHTSIAPKVRGSWNLHHALERDGRDSQLDFFVMTSSISGTVGTATESNYCAANAFLDAFARYRNRLGRAAVAIGYGMIAEVGYLHEHPDIEALLKRKGIHSITEDELLQVLDLAIASQSPSTWEPHYDGFVGAHILTGIEFIGLKEQRDRGFEGDNHVLADPRACLLAAAFERSSSASVGGSAVAGHGLPPEVAKALVEGGSAIPIVEAVQAVVARKISNLILLPVEQLRPEQRLGEFGIDSMLAAEFRTTVFHVFAVDVPFMTLLDPKVSVRDLTDIITDSLKS
ncbi:polyketide synthase [Apiospora rasikravindrae]|uniref:Polyketide synthase n=1 Tax=Apiospora rasikravindrae TaxID=990691 RepID=A0ABR1SF55_9PEZI